MPAATGQCALSSKKGVVYTYQSGGKLDDADSGIGTFSEAMAIILALAEAEPWGGQINRVTISITAPEPEATP